MTLESLTKPTQLTVEMCQKEECRGCYTVRRISFRELPGSFCLLTADESVDYFLTVGKAFYWRVADGKIKKGEVKASLQDAIGETSKEVYLSFPEKV